MIRTFKDKETEKIFNQLISKKNTNQHSKNSTKKTNNDG